MVPESECNTPTLMVSSAAIAGDAQSIAVPSAAAARVFSNLVFIFMSNPSCIYFCLMQREGALQSLCQLVNEVLILEIAETYHTAMVFWMG
jgi:hypothetical protein